MLLRISAPVAFLSNQRADLEPAPAELACRTVVGVVDVKAVQVVLSARG